MSGKYNVIGNSLLPSKRLNTCDALKSTDGNYLFAMQSDGNAVVYNQFGAVTWATATDNNGEGPWSMRYQSDGNFVLYDNNDDPLWSANVKGTPGNVAMRDNGNLVVYGTENNNASVWTSSSPKAPVPDRYDQSEWIERQGWLASMKDKDGHPF